MIRHLSSPSRIQAGMVIASGVDNHHHFPAWAMAALIEDLTGVRYHPGHVWRLLGASGFSCQRPERRAVERDEKAIRRWQRVEWPALKKKPAGKNGPSSS